MNLNLSNFGTLVPAAICCVLCSRASNLRFDTDDMVFASILVADQCFTEQLTDTKIYFKEIRNVFDFETLITSADYVPQE